MGMFDSQRIEFTCPGCSRKLSETFGKMKTAKQVSYPVCGDIEIVRDDKTVAAFKALEAAEKNLLSSLGKLGGKRK